MRNLVIGLLIGAALSVATSTLLAQRRPDPFPDSVTADPMHYTVAFENQPAGGGVPVLMRRPEMDFLDDGPGKPVAMRPLSAGERGCADCGSTVGARRT